MPATTRWTADMVRALPDDGKRYEVIDGELFVTPSPALRHQDAVYEMASLSPMGVSFMPVLVRGLPSWW